MSKAIQRENEAIRKKVGTTDGPPAVVKEAMKRATSSKRQKNG
jgi:hypothetical protein